MTENNILSKLSALKWGDWLYTLLSAGIGAGAASIAANPIASIIGAQQFTPRQLGIMAASAAIVAMAGVLRKSPLPDRSLDIALLPGVTTREDVADIVKATAPGTVPTPAEAVNILNSSRP